MSEKAAAPDGVDPATGEILDTDGKGGPPQDPPTKLFAAWLNEQREGGLHNELTEALQEVAQAVIDLQKKGSLSLTIQIVPAGKGIAQVLITDDVKAKPPVDKPASLFFTDGRGNLSRRDPNQTTMPLRDVSKPEPRDLPPKG